MMEHAEFSILDLKVKGTHSARVEVVKQGKPLRVSSPGYSGLIVVEDALAMVQVGTVLGEYPSGDLILTKELYMFAITSKQSGQRMDVTGLNLLLECSNGRIVVSTCT